MRIIYIYNKENAKEVELLTPLKQELGNYATEVIVKDVMDVRDVYPISQTPALITIREDMQGEALITEDQEKGKFRVVLEAWKHLQEEEGVLHNVTTNRIDIVVQDKIQQKMGENYQVMQDMAALLEESGAV